MKHEIIRRVEERVEHAKGDSDFTYFWSLLLLGETAFKTTTLGVLAALTDDRDRNRYRLEHSLVKADGLGDWAKALEDALTGPAAQFLFVNAYPERNELTKICNPSDWQYDAVLAMKQTLDALKIESEELPTRSDMKRWFRLFATLRNKTRAHGATLPSKTSAPAVLLKKSIDLFLNNYCLLKRPWAFLHQNLSGKYRVAPITPDTGAFDDLKKTTNATYRNGIYIHYGTPRLVPLIESDADFEDFYFANGGLTAKKFECLSYATDNKRAGDASAYYTPPGTLPASETEGLSEFGQQGRCLSNAPASIHDYIARPTLEAQLHELLLDDRRHIVTLLGRGGIGKTSLALRAIKQVCEQDRFDVIVWFSARDVDLQSSGPRPVHPHVLSPEDMSKYYMGLVAPEKLREKGFNARVFFETQLQKNDLGPCLYIFGSVAKSVGQNGTSQGQAGESVTRGDRRRRELEARSSSPPLARLPLRCGDRSIQALRLFKCRKTRLLQPQRYRSDPQILLTRHIFDNFETSQTPVEVFSWIDTFLRLPNKALITTRLRDFKGDYSVEVGGMEDDEASALITQTAHGLGISGLISPAYVAELIQVSEGHPYVMKILLGEVARERKAGHIPRLVANRDEILLALFERTYASMPPCAQRVFMTLASWNSAVARISLEAVLHRTIPDSAEVERSIDLLLQYSLAEKTTTVENQEFLGLPLVASVFGKRKLNVCPIQAAIKTDVELLQMFGPAHRGDVQASLLKRIEAFLGNVSHKLERGEPFSRFEQIIEMICRNYHPGWLAVARWYMEEESPDSLAKAKTVLRRFLEEDSTSDEAAEAWRSLAVCCFKTNDTMGEIHAFIERSKIASVPFDDLSNTANRLNILLRAHAIDVGVDEKRILAGELLQAIKQRKREATADDFSRMTWLAIHVRDYVTASDFVRAGLALEPDNPYLLKLAESPVIRV